MNRFLPFILILCLSLSVFAQVPQKFSYQAVIRDAQNTPLENANVSLKISLLSGGSDGAVVYSETHAAQSNELGLVSLQVGNGSAEEGNFATIDWSASTYFIKIELDPDGGNNYSLMGTSQLLSVPFALHAKSADNIGAGATAAGDMQYWNGNSWELIPAGKPGQYLQLSAQGLPVWAGPEFATVSTSEASDISYISATGSGEVISDGNAEVTSRGLCWSTFSQPTLNDGKITSGSGTGTYSGTLSGLSNNTTYYVRAFAVNEAGTAYGNEVSFTTLTNIAPVLSTAAITEISYTTALAGGEITDWGGTEITERGVTWNTSGSPTMSDNIVSAGTGDGAFSCTITGLEHNTTYYVRAFATNSTGTTLGDELSFTTRDYTLPVVSTSAISNIWSVSAQSGGNITDNGGVEITARGVCWSKNPEPDINDSLTTDGTGDGTYTSYLADLSMGETYYVRAYASNSLGTSYGEERSFTAAPGLGENVLGGYVFYLFKSGDPGYVAGETHGLIASVTDLTVGPWGCSGTTISGADGSALGTGMQNTIDIVNDCHDAGTAAMQCYVYSVDEFYDWYLPGSFEAMLLYQNRQYIGTYSNGYYWTSTEFSSGYAYAVPFLNGRIEYMGKSNVYNVRAIRTF